MIPTGRPLNPNWSDEVEQRFLAKQRLDEVAFRHDATLDNVAQASDADGYFWFCSYCDQEWRHEVPKTCPVLAEAISACEAAGCTHAEIAMVVRWSV